MPVQMKNKIAQLAHAEYWWRQFQGGLLLMPEVPAPAGEKSWIFSCSCPIECSRAFVLVQENPHIDIWSQRSEPDETFKQVVYKVEFRLKTRIRGYQTPDAIEQWAAKFYREVRRQPSDDWADAARYSSNFASAKAGRYGTDRDFDIKVNTAEAEAFIHEWVTSFRF